MHYIEKEEKQKIEFDYNSEAMHNYWNHVYFEIFILKFQKNTVTNDTFTL